MEGTMDMTSNATNSTAAASAPDNQQQVALVSSLTEKEAEARDSKKPRVAQQAGGSGEPKPRPLLDAALSCPRCCSTNTKFCYYNNYNLNQPRYFCKACRHYWTLGGTLRQIPIGGGFRTNKRASGSSSSSAAASSTAATSAEVDKTVMTRLMLTATATATTTSTTLSMPSPTTDLFPNDMLPAFTPIDNSGFDLDLAMKDQQGFLPFSPLSLFDDHAPELAPGGSDEMTPSLLDMLRGGYFDCGGSSSYDADLDMSGCNNGMDIPFPLLELGALTTDPIETQLMEGMNDVAGELLWSSSEFDNYINDDGGYGVGPAARVQQQQVVVQQQQVVGDQQQHKENKETDNSKNNNNNDNGVSLSVYNYGINTNNNRDGAEG